MRRVRIISIKSLTLPLPLSHLTSEVALHMVSCIVHRTITLDTGEKAWEALDGGNWATLKVREAVRSGDSC